MPCADLRQRGAALIMALLAMALVAGTAAAMIGDFGHSLEIVSGRHDQTQARILARGAVDWARNVLAEDDRTSTVDHALEPWNVKVPPTPVEEGEVSGELQDLSGLFNLNNLVSSGKVSTQNQSRMIRLLEILNIPAGRAQVLTSTLIDWLDNNQVAGTGDGAETTGTATDGSPIAPFDGPLVHIDELIHVPGFDAELVDRLRPYVTALPSPSDININQSPAEVLAVVVSGLDPDQARVLVAERERAWFKDVADFVARLPEGAEVDDISRIAVKSRYFLATGRARYGVAVARMDILLDRKQRWSDIIWQRIL